MSEEQARAQAERCLSCHVDTIYDPERCVLCNRCADVCPEKCLVFVPLDRVEMPEEQKQAALDELRPRPDEAHDRPAEGRHRLHPLRAVRPALPDRRDDDGTLQLHRNHGVTKVAEKPRRATPAPSPAGETPAADAQARRGFLTRLTGIVVGLGALADELAVRPVALPQRALRAPAEVPGRPPRGLPAGGHLPRRAAGLPLPLGQRLPRGVGDLHPPRLHREVRALQAAEGADRPRAHHRVARRVPLSVPRLEVPRRGHQLRGAGAAAAPVLPRRDLPGGRSAGRRPRPGSRSRLPTGGQG